MGFLDLSKHLQSQDCPTDTAPTVPPQCAMLLLAPAMARLPALIGDFGWHRRSCLLPQSSVPDLVVKACWLATPFDLGSAECKIGRWPPCISPLCTSQRWSLLCPSARACSRCWALLSELGGSSPGTGLHCSAALVSVLEAEVRPSHAPWLGASPAWRRALRQHPLARSRREMLPPTLVEMPAGRHLLSASSRRLPRLPLPVR